MFGASPAARAHPSSSPPPSKGAGENLFVGRGGAWVVCPEGEGGVTQPKRGMGESAGLGLGGGGPRTRCAGGSHGRPLGSVSAENCPVWKGTRALPGGELPGVGAGPAELGVGEARCWTWKMSAGPLKSETEHPCSLQSAFCPAFCLPRAGTRRAVARGGQVGGEEEGRLAEQSWRRLGGSRCPW